MATTEDTFSYDMTHGSGRILNGFRFRFRTENFQPSRKIITNAFIDTVAKKASALKKDWDDRVTIGGNIEKSYAMNTHATESLDKIRAELGKEKTSRSDFLNQAIQIVAQNPYKYEIFKGIGDYLAGPYYKKSRPKNILMLSFPTKIVKIWEKQTKDEEILRSQIAECINSVIGQTPLEFNESFQSYWKQKDFLEHFLDAENAGGKKLRHFAVEVDEKASAIVRSAMEIPEYLHPDFNVRIAALVSKSMED